LRLDFHHSGTKVREFFSLDHIRQEGPWPGSRVNLLDTLALGDYMILLFDASNQRLLYSRGFASSFEAKDQAATDVDSVRIPCPRQLTRAVIRMRRAVTGRFHDAWSGLIDPASLSIDRRDLPKVTIREFLVQGDPASKVDLLILGDGYREDERNKFWSDTQRAFSYLISTSPFTESQRSFNVHAVFLPGEESGITSPRDGIWLWVAGVGASQVPAMIGEDPHQRPSSHRWRAGLTGKDGRRTRSPAS
jgi:IgA Peptidase M64